MSNNLTVNNNLLVKENTNVNNLDVSNNLTVNNNLLVKEDAIANNLDVSNNLTVNNNLLVKENTNVNNLDVSNNLTVNNNLLVKEESTFNKSVTILNDLTSTHIGLVSPGYGNFNDLSCTRFSINNMKFPIADGSLNQLITTDGSGNLTWTYKLGNTLNNLSDVLIENNSLYIGNEPSNTNNANCNIGIGITALKNITSGDNNVAIGHNSSINSTSASSNITIGKNAGDSLTVEGDNIVIGTNAEIFLCEIGSTNQIVIGTGAQGRGVNYAVIGNNNIKRVYASQDGGADVYGNRFVSMSDNRLKKNISNLNVGLDFIKMLEPVSYQWIKDKHDGQTRLGLIAQQVEDVMVKFNMNEKDFSVVDYDDVDDTYRLNYIELISPIIKSIHELDNKVDLNYNDLKLEFNKNTDEKTKKITSKYDKLLLDQKETNNEIKSSMSVIIKKINEFDIENDLNLKKNSEFENEINNLKLEISNENIMINNNKDNLSKLESKLLLIDEKNLASKEDINNVKNDLIQMLKLNNSKLKNENEFLKEKVNTLETKMSSVLEKMEVLIYLIDKKKSKK